MRRLILTSILCLPLVACGGSEKSCDSDDVLKSLHSKLVEGLNFEIGVKDYYSSNKGKLTLKDPREVGKSGEFTRCSITMVMTHYVDPKTNARYPAPQEKSLPMPYSFKVIDAMITQVKVAE